MKNPNIKTIVVHSQSKSAWNVVGLKVGDKYKIAIIPYHTFEDSEILNTKNKNEALIHAQFISKCFNNSDKIIDYILP